MPAIIERLPAVSLVVALVACAGCKRERSGDERAAPQGAASGAASAASAAPAGDRTLESRESKERAVQVKVLLDEWLRAQNGGDFSAYEKLYASRFTGIKRVGQRTMRFDRDGWMKDRKAMFARPFSVRMDEPLVSAGETSAVVTLQQTWSSASFRDVGTKELVLSLEGGNLRIASEEMKTSSAGSTGSPTASPNPREFAFVVQAPGPLVILSDQVDLNTVEGPLTYVTDELARRPVVTSALPVEQRSLLGAAFTAYGANGRVCEGTIEGFEVLVSLHAHFGTTQTWNGQLGAVTPPAERALELWQLSAHEGRFLVARLRTPSPCEGALWARASALPLPKLWSQRTPSLEERGALLTAVRKTELHRTLQRDFEQAFHKQIPWDDSGSEPQIRLFEDGLGQTFAALGLSSGVDDSCSTPFDASVFFLLQKRGADWTVVSGPPDAHAPSAWPRDLEPLRADQAFDLEGDGRPEFLGWLDLVRESGGSYRSVLNRTPGYFDCPC